MIKERKKKKNSKGKEKGELRNKKGSKKVIKNKKKI